MTPDLFFSRALAAAVRGGHLFPAYAVCEAAEESGWAESELSSYNNLFGQKWPEDPPPGWIYPKIQIPTWEVVNGERVRLVGPQAPYWPVFPGWTASFRERMALLRRLGALRLEDGAPRFPGYAAALAATSGEQFVVEVSKDWSTDPQRADNVLTIYKDHAGMLQPLLAQVQRAYDTQMA